MLTRHRTGLKVPVREVIPVSKATRLEGVVRNLGIKNKKKEAKVK